MTFFRLNAFLHVAIQRFNADVSFGNSFGNIHVELWRNQSRHIKVRHAWLLMFFFII